MNVLYPVFAMFALTIGVVLRLAAMRFAAVKHGKVNPRYYEAHLGEEPPHLRIASRHLSNLLELPLLFYVGCLLAFVTHQSGMFVVALAWAYVALRVIHTLIHLGSNVVLWRFRVFAMSVLVLIALWLVLFIGLAAR